jgi:glycosyltransferase involved in cell wall biosynthesis
VPESLLTDLTIVIPTYRCVRYLPATIASALKVPGAPIVIAEDCGGDDTLRLAHELAAAHPDRITVSANEKNLGITGNWQQAVGKVTTPFAVNLCDDDLISARYLIEAVTLLRQNPSIGMVGGNLLDVQEDFALDLNIPADVPVTEQDFAIMRGTAAARFALEWQPLPAASSTVYRMEAWRKVGGYDMRLTWCMDREIWFRIGRTYDVAFCHKLAVYYRILDTSVTAQHRRGDKFCYELSHMLRENRTRWPERELKPLFRRGFAVTAKAFLGSSLRAARRGRMGEVIPRAWRGIRDAARSFPA